MKKALYSLVLSASLMLSSVPALASGTDTVSINQIQEETSFDRSLSYLYDQSMTITDQEILAVADEMQSDFSAIEDYDEDLVDALKSYEAAKANFLLGEGECSYGEAIGEEWSRQKYYTEFGLGSSHTLTSLVPRIQIQSVTETESGLELAIFEWNTEGYQTEGSAAVSASAYGFYFTLVVSEQNGTYAVTSVKDLDENYSTYEAQGVTFTAEGITYAEVESEDEDLLVGALKTTTRVTGFVYDVDKAIAYSDQWAKSRNPKYSYYGGQGGDCANFVSQSLYAGGLETNANWHPSEKDENIVGFYAWVNNDYLRRYLVDNNFGTYVKDHKASDMEAGDLVFYSWTNRDLDDTDHVTIVVGRNSAGEPIVNSHTAVKYHEPWNYGGASTRYGLVQMKKGNQQNLVSTTIDENSQYVYRVYNKKSGEHFYTTSVGEKNYLVSIGWYDEGIGWAAPKKSKTPVYRLYNPNAGDHHYTTSRGERDYLVKLGWNDEGILCYSNDSKEVPVYRQYNPNAKAGAHNFTTSKGENDVLVKAGWKAEGIAWYGSKMTVTTTKKS